MLDIPLDIVFTIIERLDASTDRKTLKSLALCDRTCRCLAQKQLFRSIFLGTKDDIHYLGGTTVMHNRQLRFARFAEILEVSQHISSHVRSVRCTLFDDYEEDTSVMGYIISRLPSLREIHLEACCSNLHWPSFGLRHRKFHKAVVDLIQQPNLVHLCVENISEFPLDLFTNRNYAIDVSAPAPYKVNIDIVEGTYGEYPSITKQRPVRAYATEWGGPQTSFPDIDFSTIQRLSISLSLDQDIQFCETLMDIAHHMEQLRIEVPNPMMFAKFSEVLLRKVPYVITTSLQSLDLDLYDGSNGDIMYAELSKSLQLIGCKNILKTLSISIHFSPNVHNRKLIVQTMKQLDNIVYRRAFPCLTMLKVRFLVMLPWARPLSASDRSAVCAERDYNDCFKAVREVEGLKFSCVTKTQR